MESKKVILNFGIAGSVEARADNALLRHLIDLYKKEAKLNQKEVFELFNFGKGSVWYGSKRAKKGMSDKAIEFIQIVGEDIHLKFGYKYIFSTESNEFVDATIASRKEFKDGTYYGYFKTSNKIEDSTTHFILIVKGKRVSVSSQTDLFEGQLIDDNGLTYHALLKCKLNKTNFFIGKKNYDPLEKVFLGTWSNKKDQMCCALCLAIYIKDTPYKSIEDIEKHKLEDHSKIHNEILSKKPSSVDSFLNKQLNKYIMQNSDFDF